MKLDHFRERQKRFRPIRVNRLNVPLESELNAIADREKKMSSLTSDQNAKHNHYAGKL